MAKGLANFGLGPNQSVTKQCLKAVTAFRSFQVPAGCSPVTFLRHQHGCSPAVPAQARPDRSAVAQVRPPAYCSERQHDRSGPIPCKHRFDGVLSARAPPPKFGYSSFPAPTRTARDASRLLGRPLLLAAHPAGTLSASPDTGTTELSGYEADVCGAVPCGAGRKRFVFVTEAPV